MNALNETDIYQNTYIELGLDNWFKELLGQPFTYTNFKIDKAFDSVPRTELTTANAIADKYANRLTYVPTTQTWYIWNGTIHVPCDDDGIALKIVQSYFYTLRDAVAFIASAIDLEYQHIKTSSNKDALKEATAYKKSMDYELNKHRSFRDKVATDRTQKSLVAILKRTLDVSRDHYEHDNNFLVVRNGVIDIAQFKAEGKPTLLPHDPARAVYRYFDADFDETAQAPQWKKFLETSIIDADTAALLQKGVGAAFAATYKPRVMFNLLGAPASGKSLFLSVFNKLGQDYSVMPNNQAIQVSGNDTNFFQESMRGARFIGFSEVQGKKALDDGFIKGIMGGDEQKTRTLHARERGWVPQGVMFVASNMALKVDFRDDATFNKILPIPFPWSFTDIDPEHKLDRDLEDKVLAERNGVLIWVLQGMKKFWEEGAAATEASMRAMDTNKVANSYALQFMQELIDLNLITESDPYGTKTDFIKMGDAYTAFKFWADGQGVKNVTGKQTFNEDIKKAYHGECLSGGKRFSGLVMSPLMRQLVENNGNTSGISLAYRMTHLDELVV